MTLFLFLNQWLAFLFYLVNPDSRSQDSNIYSMKKWLFKPLCKQIPRLPPSLFTLMLSCFLRFLRFPVHSYLDLQASFIPYHITASLISEPVIYTLLLWFSPRPFIRVFLVFPLCAPTDKDVPSWCFTQLVVQKQQFAA